MAVDFGTTNTGDIALTPAGLVLDALADAKLMGRLILTRAGQLGHYPDRGVGVDDYRDMDGMTEADVLQICEDELLRDGMQRVQLVEVDGGTEIRGRY